MSNLLKQHYVVNLKTEKKIINADERYYGTASKVSASTKQVYEGITGSSIPCAEEIIDGFLAGLAAEEIVLEPQPDPEEILLQAQSEADAIVAAARTEASQIIANAQGEAEQLCQQKMQEGYRAGTAKMQEELNAKISQLESQHAARIQELQASYEGRLETMESDIVDVMIQVFNKVFNIQFDNKKQILLHLIKDTLLGVDAGKEFHIRVSDANFKFIESHVADIKEKIGNDVVVDVINDMTLEDEDCMIETRTGVFNCGIDMVLSNLEKDIRSLCK